MNIWDKVKFLKGCLPQILLGPFLNTLAHLGFALKSSFDIEVMRFGMCDGCVAVLPEYNSLFSQILYFLTVENKVET